MKWLREKLGIAALEARIAELEAYKAKVEAVWPEVINGDS